MARDRDLLSVALIVSTLLFLMACPVKVGGGTGDASAAPDGTGEVKPIHSVGGWVRAPHQRHLRISLPRLYRTSGNKAIPKSFEDLRPAGWRRSTQW